MSEKQPIETIRIVHAVPIEDHRQALARIEELERMIYGRRWCPECGPVQMDSEGCCPTCGNGVDGAFVRRLLGEDELK